MREWVRERLSNHLGEFFIMNCHLLEKASEGSIDHADMEANDSTISSSKIYIFPSRNRYVAQNCKWEDSKIQTQRDGNSIAQRRERFLNKSEIINTHGVTAYPHSFSVDYRSIFN